MGNWKDRRRTEAAKARLEYALACLRRRDYAALLEDWWTAFALADDPGEPPDGRDQLCVELGIDVRLSLALDVVVGDFRLTNNWSALVRELDNLACVYFSREATPLEHDEHRLGSDDEASVRAPRVST